MDYFKRVRSITPTYFWINNVTRRQARMAIEAGAVSATQNPAYLSKVLKSADDGEYLMQIARQIDEVDIDSKVSELQRRAIAGICDEFLPLFESSGGRLGLVSIQANPFKETVDEILSNAEKSLKLAENFIIKIPATEDGLKAIAQLIKERVAVLATEVMSIDQAISVLETHQSLTSAMKNPAPFWVAHINGIFDEHLAEYADKNAVDISPDVLRLGSLALARKITGYMREKGYTANYLAGGARGLNHFTDWVGVTGAVTINWSGTADKLIETNPPVADVFNAPTPYAALDELIEKLPEFRTAWTPHSLKPADYERFGPVVRFRDSFERGWQTARETIGV